MDVLHAVVLVVAGGVMGFVNNLAGAGGVLGLLALQLAGLTPATANTTMRLSAVAIGLVGLLAFRGRNRRLPGRAWLYGLAAAPGAAAGALLAITLPEWLYQLVLAAVLVALLWQQWRAGPIVPADGHPPRSPWLGALLFTLVGLHMGFVQVGTGLVAILAITAISRRDLVAVNHIKLAVVLVVATTSSAVLAGAGSIRWTPALLLAAGCGAGSFAATRWSLKRGHGAVRRVVLAVALLALAHTSWSLVSS